MVAASPAGCGSDNKYLNINTMRCETCPANAEPAKDCKYSYKLQIFHCFHMGGI